MSASKCGLNAAEQSEISLETGIAALKSLPSEIECINSRHGGCCADGMDVSTYTAVEGVGP